MLFLKDFFQIGTVMTSEPGKVLLGWGKRTWVSPQNSKKYPLFYFPDYFLENSEPCFYHAHTIEMPIEEFKLYLKLSEGGFDPITWNFPAEYEKEGMEKLFYRVFEKLQVLFKETSLQKVVPFLFQTAFYKMTPERLLLSLKQAVENLEKAPLFLYGFWDFSKESVSNGILGMTPEILAIQEDLKTLKTAAVAGTVPISEKEELLKDKKLQHEHQLVIEGIKDVLLHFGTIACEPSQIVTMGPLCHLKTSISLNFSSSYIFSPATFLNMVSVLHPTPALGGFPKNEALKWLKNRAEELSILPRNRFGAPVGCLASDRAVCYVAIRNIQWEKEKILMGAGCGIVKESKKEAEWDELMLKLNTIKNLLKI